MNLQNGTGEKHELKARIIGVPLELFKDKELSHGDKFLVVIIDMLDSGPDRCYASNKYLADLLDMTEQTVVNKLTKLKKAGWVWDWNEEGRGVRGLTTRLRNARELLSVVPTQKSCSTNSKEYEAPTQKSLGYKDIEIKEREEDPLTIFKEIFPDFTPSCFQQDLILNSVTNINEWRKSLIYWAGNGNQPKSISKLLDMHVTNERLLKETTLSKTPVTAADPCPFCTGPTGPSSCPGVAQHGRCNW